MLHMSRPRRKREHPAAKRGSGKSSRTKVPRAKRPRRAPSQTAGHAPEHFLVIVPGFLGSRLVDRTTGEAVWIDFSRVPLNPLDWEGWLDHLFTAMRYPNDNLEPAGIIDDVIFAQPWIKQEQYSRLLRALEGLGYRVDPTRYSEAERNVYMFAYDWRQDNRISGRQLGEAIERWRQFHPGAKAWLLAHSNGGIVSRWYIEKQGGKKQVGRLILLASPWDGAVKGMYMLFNGLDTLFRQGFSPFDIPRRTRETLRTFPSIYQLIPHVAPFLQGPDHAIIRPLATMEWLDGPEQRNLVADARKFNRELGTRLSVETLVFFGRNRPTMTAGIVHYGPGQRWNTIEWQTTEDGDGTLPERTAVFARARQNIPVTAGHGDIYVHPAVNDILLWELVDKYKVPSRAAIRVQGLSVDFGPDRDIYQPGDRIDLWVVVGREADRKPVSGAQIKVRLEWRQSLPGSRQAKTSEALPAIDLAEVENTLGRYEGYLRAPQAEGYYQLTATVHGASARPLTVQELIAVEAAPGAASI